MSVIRETSNQYKQKWSKIETKIPFIWSNRMCFIRIQKKHPILCFPTLNVERFVEILCYLYRTFSTPISLLPLMRLGCHNNNDIQLLLWNGSMAIL